jgi:hypothetical protein
VPNERKSISASAKTNFAARLRSHVPSTTRSSRLIFWGATNRDRNQSIFNVQFLYESEGLAVKSVGVLVLAFCLLTLPALASCPYDTNCIDNPYGAGNPYAADGLMNPFSRYGSQYSNDSWTNPYATNAPALIDDAGNYRGRLSDNPYEPDSTSNPYGRYGSQYSQDSINNPYGAGNPYSQQKIYVIPAK